MTSPVLSYSSAAQRMKAPPGFYASAAFSYLRWTTAGEQRDERMRLLCRKLLKRLDGMEMPFYPAVGLMDRKTAQHRYVCGYDPWPPIASPYLDGVAIMFKHCLLEQMEPKCWELFAEVAFDVARLAAIPIAWGGFCTYRWPGYIQLYTGPENEVVIDGRTYGSRLKHQLEYRG